MRAVVSSIRPLQAFSVRDDDDGYLRVPTEEQAKSGLGLGPQRDTIQRYADAHSWEVVWHVPTG